MTDIDALIEQNVETSKQVMAFAEEHAEEPVVWGQSDCSTWPALWVARRMGKQLAIPEYNSEEEAMALIKEYGGLEHVWAHIADAAGIVPQPIENGFHAGDVGVVQNSEFTTGCIFLKYGSMAVVRARRDKGYAFLPPRKATILAAWRVP